MKESFKIEGESDLGLKVGDTIEVKGKKFTAVKFQWNYSDRKTQVTITFYDESEWLKDVTYITVAEHERQMQELWEMLLSPKVIR